MDLTPAEALFRLVQGGAVVRLDAGRATLRQGTAAMRSTWDRHKDGITRLLRREAAEARIRAMLAELAPLEVPAPLFEFAHTRGEALHEQVNAAYLAGDMEALEQACTAYAWHWSDVCGDETGWEVMR